jgi:hypothetical protein
LTDLFVSKQPAFYERRGTVGRRSPMSKPVCVISEHDFVASIADALQYVAV